MKIKNWELLHETSVATPLIVCCQPRMVGQGEIWFPVVCKEGEVDTQGECERLVPLELGPKKPQKGNGELQLCQQCQKSRKQIRNTDSLRPKSRNRRGSQS